MNIFEPLVLSGGSHQEGSGRGCAMNVISWENGDTKITDYPACSDRMLARIVQEVNDSLAKSDGYLSAEDSIRVLDLGHATVGTAYHDLSDTELKKAHVQCAIYAARRVVHLAKMPKALAAIEAAELWVSDSSEENRSAAYAAYADADAVAYAADDADDAAAYAIDAAAEVAATAAYAAATAAAEVAATAAYAAATAAAVGLDQVQLAQEIIDLFKELTGTQTMKFDDDTFVTAVKNMQTVK